MIYKERKAKVSTKLFVLVGLPLITVAVYFATFQIYAMQHGY